MSCAGIPLLLYTLAFPLHGLESLLIMLFQKKNFTAEFMPVTTFNKSSIFESTDASTLML